MTTGARATSLTRFSLTTASADRLSVFYEQALGCRRIDVTERRGPEFDDLLAVPGGARCITLALGEEIIELIEFEYPGAPYPAHSSASDLIFQHFAVVVTDMMEAWLRLSGVPGWSAITHGLPQRLPDASGGVTAFKFRDPEGHPLEFLSFPADKRPEKWSRPSPHQTCQGIDHSAISVANAAVSTAFYEALGLKATARSLNAGPQQDALDGMSSVRVEVVALTPDRHAPHVELLCYDSAVAGRTSPCQGNDVACTRLIFKGATDIARHFNDPDGHHLIILRDVQP